LVWRRHTKFQIGITAAIPAIPLPAPLSAGMGGLITPLSIHPWIGEIITTSDSHDHRWEETASSE